MKFEWNADKSAKNEVERGLSINDAALAFLDPDRSTIIDDRKDYGEERLTTFGKIEGRLYAVTHTIRGDAIRIISARKANARERARYDSKDDT